jgi:uncharacterized spore protein YtfJ
MSSTATEFTDAAPGARRTDELLSRLAEQIGSQFSASAVYGAPVDRDGVTIVPVASVRFGIGGGGGEDRDKHQDGAGAGAGGTVTPSGYIELKDGKTRYVPLVHPARMLALVAATALGVLALARPVVVGRPARRLRKR